MVLALLLRFDTKALLPGQHLCCQVCLLLDECPCKFRTFAELVAYDFVHSNQLPLLQVVENLGIWVCASALYCLKLFSRRVRY